MRWKMNSNVISVINFVLCSLSLFVTELRDNFAELDLQIQIHIKCGRYLAKQIQIS